MGQMSKASEEIFYTTNEYLTYKMSRYFDTYVLLLGLKDNSGFFMDVVDGAGVHYHLYKHLYNTLDPDSRYPSIPPYKPNELVMCFHNHHRLNKQVLTLLESPMSKSESHFHLSL